MPNYKCQFVFVALFLFVLIQKAKGLRCYTCSSLSSSNCHDPFDVQQYSLQNDCLPDQVCIKHRTHETYLTPEELKRGCADRDYCGYEGRGSYESHWETEYEYCTTCTWDLCNSSHKIAPSFAIFALILACYYLL